MGACGLTKSIIAEFKPATFQPRPGDVVLCQPKSKAVGLEGSPLKDAIISIDLGDELVLEL